jgi:aryl-alcohol dehydrogenase-like predicted oxidoreductase
MPRRRLGNTGLEVSALGLGAGQLGQAELDPAGVERCLATAVEAGINLFDAARSYGAAEERLGHFLRERRKDVVLSTKGGYGVENVPDWTGPCISQGVDRALTAFGTDWIDVFHLHSCPLAVAQRDDILSALEGARAQGKIRVAGYAGEGEALAWAVESGYFGAIECSVNIVDQVNAPLVLKAAERGVGVIAKRPLANAVWRHPHRPDAPDAGEYWSRFQTLTLDTGGLDWAEVALRFSAHLPGVSGAIVGTASSLNVTRNSAALQRGPLGPELLAGLLRHFETAGRLWAGVI